jgi:hypothetical protein
MGILIFVFVSFIGASFFGYYAFMHYYVRGVELATPEKTTQEQLSDIEILKQELDDILMYFNNKETIHQQLLQEKNTFESVLKNNPAEEYDGGATSSVEGVDVSESVDDVSVIDLLKQNMSVSASVFRPIVDLFR